MSGVAPSPYVLLGLDGLDLVLPQRDVRSLEPIADIVFAPMPGYGTAVGFIDFIGANRPVYCLDGTLSALRKAPLERRVCALLGRGGRLWGLLCDRVAILEESSLQPQLIPPCMDSPAAPVDGFALYAERLVLMTGAEPLSRLLAVPSDQHLLETA